MSLKGIIGRTGGKSKLKEKIRRMMPKHTTYIEPFVGGGSVLFSTGADPNVKEVINDLDKDVISVYQDVKKIGDQIVELPGITKEQFNRLKAQRTFSSTAERLKRNLLLSRMSFRADRKSYAPSKFRGGGIRKRGFAKYKERLKDVRILNQDYKSVIRRYDNPNALIYLDPPYSTSTGRKDYNNNDVPIEELINFLKTVKGKFILSYDNNATAKRLARQSGFKVLTVSTKYTDGKGGHTIDKKELIIRNY